MDAPNIKRYKGNGSRSGSREIVTAEVKAYLASRILLYYVNGKNRKQGCRLELDVDLFRNFLYAACRDAADKGLIEERLILQLGILLFDDHDFYASLNKRAQSL